MGLRTEVVVVIKRTHLNLKNRKDAGELVMLQKYRVKGLTREKLWWCWQRDIEGL